MGDKLSTKLQQDTSGAAQALATKQADPADILEYMSNFDPTPNNKFLQWIANAYVKGRNTLEDMGRVKTAIVQFLQYRGVLGNNDINAYKTLPDLEKALDDVMRNTSDKDVMSKKQIQKMQKEKGADVVAKLKDGTVYHIKTQEAACLYGRGTRWCTTSTHSMSAYGEPTTPFEYYSSEAPLFVFIPNNRNASEKIQMHFGEDDQVMDVHDEPITPQTLAKKYPSLIPFIANVGGINYLHPHSQRYNDDTTALSVPQVIEFGLEKYIINSKDPESLYWYIHSINDLSDNEKSNAITNTLYDAVIEGEDSTEASILARVLLSIDKPVPNELEEVIANPKSLTFDMPHGLQNYLINFEHKNIQKRKSGGNTDKPISSTIKKGLFASQPVTVKRIASYLTDMSLQCAAQGLDKPIPPYVKESLDFLAQQEDFQKDYEYYFMQLRSYLVGNFYPSKLAMKTSNIDELMDSIENYRQKLLMQYDPNI
jgi:cell division protein FtsB